MNDVGEAIGSRLVEAGLDQAAVSTIVESFVRYYRAVSEYNRLAVAAGQPPHPDSHPEREALARLLVIDGDQADSL